MARRELIEELKIRKKEIQEEIRVKFPELTEQLIAIDKLLNKNINSVQDSKAQLSYSNTNEISNHVVTKTNTKGTPKGDMTWIQYVKFILKEIGGKGKTKEVAKAIVKANNDISYNRAKDAASDKLSRLLKTGEIKATKPISKKDGYLYEIV